MADPGVGGGGGGRGERNRRLLKFDQVCFLSNFFSECLRILSKTVEWIIHLWNEEISLVEEWISLDSNSNRVKIHYSVSEISSGYSIFTPKEVITDVTTQGVQIEWIEWFFLESKTQIARESIKTTLELQGPLSGPWTPAESEFGSALVMCVPAHNLLRPPPSMKILDPPLKCVHVHIIITNACIYSAYTGVAKGGGTRGPWAPLLIGELKKKRKKKKGGERKNGKREEKKRGEKKKRKKRKENVSLRQIQKEEKKRRKRV